MKQRLAEPAARHTDVVGFAVLDDRGRVSLPKGARQALKLHAGSALAYAVVSGTIVLFPQDQHLDETSRRAAAILERAGLAVDDLVAELPVVRGEILRDSYGDAFVSDLERRHAEHRDISGDRPR